MLIKIFNVPLRHVKLLIFIYNMENSNSNPFLEVKAHEREIVGGLELSVSSPGSIGEGRLSKVENSLGLHTLAKFGHTILKIMATIAISVMIILGVVGFFPLAMISNNVLLDVMIPLFFYQGICVFALYYMWTPMKGWGQN